VAGRKLEEVVGSRNGPSRGKEGKKGRRRVVERGQDNWWSRHRAGRYKTKRNTKESD
jgi:hypothetical protein